MRVLWFTNSPCNYKRNRGYNGGGWMTALQDEIQKTDIELGISFVMGGQPEKVEQEGVTYYPVPAAVKSFKDKVQDALHPNDVHRDEVLWPHYISHFKRVIEDFQPDVIEIFGSELYMGLAALATDRPCVLHIQGLLSLYIYIYLLPGVSRWSYIMKDGIRKAWGNWQYLNYWNRSAHREKVVLQNVKHVIGRTEWDKKAAAVLNPKATYHYGGEILRANFFQPQERRIPDKLTIVSTISQPPYKGMDLVLKIANILKNEVGVDFEWKVFGNVGKQFAEKITGIKSCDVNVTLAGVASAEQIKMAILSSTMYVHPSYTENSPNSVCEAQILGVPVVATNVGGTSSLVEDGKTGLLFPATDPYMAVSAVMQLFRNINENISMGEVARKAALQRHDRAKTVENLVDIYKQIQ